MDEFSGREQTEWEWTELKTAIQHIHGYINWQDFSFTEQISDKLVSSLAKNKQMRELMPWNFEGMTYRKIG